MTPDPDSVPAPVSRKFWQTALLLAGSAAFGGLAVAFWNRKTLTRMHAGNPEPPSRPADREEDIY